MSASRKRTFSLSAEQSDFIDELVGSGNYATSSEVVRAGLRALKEREAAMERWLREEVAPAYDRLKAAPQTAIPATDVFAEIRARHAARVEDAD